MRLLEIVASQLFAVKNINADNEHINADNDPLFTGYRNQNVSDSDSSDSDQNDAI